MPDYKKLYLRMFRASEDAINLLIKAQRECEEACISPPDAGCEVIAISPVNTEDADKAYCRIRALIHIKIKEAIIR